MSLDVQTIGEGCVLVLSEGDPEKKAAIAREVAALWQAGTLACDYSVPIPDRPARPVRPDLLPPGQMPKRRKGGSLANKQALLHAVAHIELNAIDLAFDIVLRFGADMPQAFTHDWIKVGDDEARHFVMIQDCLESLGCAYGDLPAHDGLWESALATRHALDARLAIVPMVLEARGLDVTPAMIDRFERFGDEKAAGALSTIYQEEIGHVEAGTRWFKYLADKKGLNPEDHFQELVTAYFAGHLKRPFNEPARTEAGMPPGFYEPLADMLEIS